MSALPTDVERQIADAYRRMAVEARYRPAAPSDGLGNITVPVEELDLDAEARQYAEHWWEQEDDGSYVIGCANYEDRAAMIFALEAARFCCSGFGSRPFARRLLEMALGELSE
jgi:hypothetical protein